MLEALKIVDSPEDPYRGKGPGRKRPVDLWALRKPNHLKEGKMAKQRAISHGQWRAAKLLDEISCTLSEMWELPLVEAERRQYMRLTKNIIDMKYLHKDSLRNTEPDPDERINSGGDPRNRTRRGEKAEMLGYEEALDINTGRPEKNDENKGEDAEIRKSGENISQAPEDMFVKVMYNLKISTDIPEEKKLVIFKKIAALAGLNILLIESEG